MDKKLADSLKEFEAVFGASKDQPGYESLCAEFIKMWTEHPEWQKPSDLPLAQTFHYIDWDSSDFVGVFIKSICNMKLRLYDEQEKSLKNGTYGTFVEGLIADVVSFKAVAMAMHAKIDIMKNPVPGSRAMIHAVK